MQTMLLRLAGQGFARAETVRRILAAFPEPQKKTATGDCRNPGAALPTPGSSNPSPTASWTSWRLLRERLSNKEIAHKLGLSPATVKRHTVNLYGKLGVNKRWDAVIKAEALGILPPR